VVVAVAATCVLTVRADLVVIAGFATAACVLCLTERFALVVVSVDVSLASGAVALVSVVGAASVVGAGCSVAAGAGSPVTGCAASWARAWVDDSARAAAIAGKARVRA
jgi:disulfide bond formation protein DsbB